MTAAAELVLRGGRVFTGDGLARAVAVGGGRVLAVGEEGAVADLIGPRTRVVDLAGRLALPGLHDAHTHLLGGALAEEQLDLTGARSSEDLAAAVAARIAEQGPGGWVLGRGWDSDRFPGRAWPERAVLDAVSPDTPVLLRRRDGHAAIANDRALALAELGPETPDPPGGRLLREGGALSGILLEDPALELVTRCVPRPDRAARERALAQVAARAAALGVTSVQDDPSFDPGLEAGAVYAALWGRGELPLRVELWRRLGAGLDDLRAEEAALARTGAPPERVRYGLLKGFLDGSLGSRTALLHEPYADDPSAGVGVAVLEADDAAARTVGAHAAGYQVGLHAIGDRAATVALDAFAAAADHAGADSVRARRHRIEHAQLLRPADVARLRGLGAVASVQPIHLASDLPVVPERLGPDRGAEIGYPWRGLLDAGALVALGTDYPVEPLDPVPNLFTAVTRRSPREPTGPAFVPEQALTLTEALAAYTLGAARAAGRGDVLGRLAPGYLADLAVLDPDPFDLPPDEWLGIRNVLTVLDGEVVFDAAG